MSDAPTSAAERQRRHRARRKQGRFVVPVEVTCEMITALVDQGDVDEANSSDLDCVGEAIAAAARRDLDLTVKRKSISGDWMSACSQERSFEQGVTA